MNATLPVRDKLSSDWKRISIPPWARNSEIHWSELVCSFVLSPAKLWRCEVRSKRTQNSTEASLEIVTLSSTLFGTREQLNCCRTISQLFAVLKLAITTESDTMEGKISLRQSTYEYPPEGVLSYYTKKMSHGLSWLTFAYANRWMLTRK